jgi:hypothetical protein
MIDVDGTVAGAARILRGCAMASRHEQRAYGEDDARPPPIEIDVGEVAHPPARVLRKALAILQLRRGQKRR